MNKKLLPYLALILYLFIALTSILLCKRDRLKENAKAPREYIKEEIIPEPTKLDLILTEEDRYIPVLYTYYEMELTYLGTYFLTAYCPWECGYNGSNYPAGWQTASGAICHRADWEYRLSEPTTCAISRSIHYFGEEFYIPEFDRVFVAEDTGPGVQGHHLDLFYEDYDDMAAFPTGYYEVYSVEWVEVTVVLTEDEYYYLKEHPATEYYWELE